VNCGTANLFRPLSTTSMQSITSTSMRDHTMSPSRPEFQDFLALEIKKEMADRYFGFRKLIEEDKLDFSEKARKDPLVQRFLALIALPPTLFYDPYLTESPTIRARAFEGVRLHGLTRAGRFGNLFFDCYGRLEAHVEQYREKFAELQGYQKEINEEIDAFYRKNDLGTIMGFLRALGDEDRTGGMAGGMETGMAQDLENKMRIEPQLPVEHYLPIMPPLPALSSIRGELKKLVQESFRLHGPRVLSQIGNGGTVSPGTGG